MMQIEDSMNSAWTSLSELLQGEGQPHWGDAQSSQREIQSIIEQNKLLKAIKEKIQYNQKVKSLNSVDKNSCYNEENSHNRSTSNSSKQSKGSKRRINRSFQTLKNKPIRKQALAISEYQKILTQIHGSISPHQLSILSNLIWQLKQSRVKSKELKSKQLLLMSQLSQYNSVISNLEQQLKRYQSRIHNLESNTKTKQKEIVLKQKSLHRFEMILFLKQKMLFQQSKKVDSKSIMVHQKQQNLERQRIEVQGLYSWVVDQVRVGEGEKQTILGKYRDYLTQQRQVLIDQERQLESQHQYLIKLIQEIDTIKIVSQPM